MTSRLRRDLRTRRFWHAFLLHTFSAVGVIAAGLQAFDVIKPQAVATADFPVVGVATAIAFAYGAIRAWPRPIRQFYPLANTEIRIVEGNLFERDTNLVIGMADTFDTAVPHIIAEGSVQGQLLSSVYHGDVASLDAELAQALAGVAPVRNLAKQGKTEAYDIGTIASIRHQRRFFFCVAYSSMNEKNEARASVDGMWRSLDNLWREVRAVANGAPLAIPVLGGGLARVSQVLPAQDSIRFIALSFMLASRAERICERLDIVIRKEDVPKVDMLEIRSFLKSLRPS